MGLVYALFTFGAVGNTNKICAANNVEFNPYPYQNQSDLEQFLLRPGNENVSSRFNSVILFGFISNTIIAAFLILKIITKKSVQDKYVVTLTFYSIAINIMWIVQFSMLVIFRFS